MWLLRNVSFQLPTFHCLKPVKINQIFLCLEQVTFYTGLSEKLFNSVLEAIEEFTKGEHVDQLSLPQDIRYQTLNLSDHWIIQTSSW